MKRFRLWAVLVLAFVGVVAGLGAWWNYDLRWRPQTITRHADDIASLLEGAGWVSSGATGPKLYMVSFRSCPECVRFAREEAPDLLKAGVDVRVIEIARADYDGAPSSTPAERATVAELWLNRSWTLLQDWEAAPADAWTAPGLPPADGDSARTAVVEAGRRLVTELTPLLSANHIDFAYPLLIWRTRDGTMRGCACERPETWRHVRRELGAD